MAESAYVQRQKKCTYTVTSIKNIELWRKDQINEDVVWQIERQELRKDAYKRAEAIVRGDAQGSLIHNDIDHAESRYIDIRAGKVAPKAAQPAPPTEIEPEPSKGLYDHFKTFVANIWRNANFSR